MEPLPKFLYKYQPCTSHSLENLAAHRIWFSTPDMFNDPFDCNFDINLQNPTTEETTSIINRMEDNQVPGVDLSDRFYPAVAEQYKTNGQANFLAETRLQEILPFLKECVFERERNKIYTKWGVACFTVKKLDTLMWSHYADGHRGFCLEFDTSSQLLQRGQGSSGALRVQYRKNYPVFKLATIFDQQENVVEEILTTKGCSFRREREYRIVRSTGQESVHYDPAILRAVYFGANITHEKQFKIADALKGTHTKFYRMKKSTNRFLLTYEPSYLAI